MRFNFAAAIVAVGLCLVVAGVSMAEEVNVYWRVDLNQGSYIIAYGQGETEQAAWADCRRIRAITRAMTAAETRKSNVSAVTTQAVRWCKNPMQLATVRPDPIAPPPGGTARLSWTPPTRNTDGTAITNLSGYRIVYGRSPTELTQSVQIQPASTYALPELAPGTWYFAAHTLAGGNQSVQSNVVTRVIP